VNETEPTMTLPEAARALRLSWGRCWRLVLTGRLVGRQDARGRYHVTKASVRAFQKGEAGTAVARAS
jgi:hypothetical protein